MLPKFTAVLLADFAQTTYFAGITAGPALLYSTIVVGPNRRRSKEERALAAVRRPAAFAVRDRCRQLHGAAAAPIRAPGAPSLDLVVVHGARRRDAGHPARG
eukprot:COSAG01_NODE_5006_length_4548_cov_14.793437_5_plen_102_part_00